MTEYREILRLHSQGISQRNIADCLHYSRNTISSVLQRAKELNLSWPLSPETTDAVLDKLFIQAFKPSSPERGIHPQGDTEEWCDPETAME